MQTIRPAAQRRLSAAGLPIFVIAVFGGAMLHAQQQPEPVLTTASAALPAAVPEAPAPDTVRLLVGRSTLVDIGTPIARVSLTSADIADALVTSPSQLLVHGKVPGAISMFVWSRGGDVRRFEVAVQRDLTKLTDQVKQLFPNEAIQVHGNGRNVVLSGTVGSKDVVDRAISVALGFVEKKEDVVTLLQVREGPISNQVLLRVRFAEVSRSALTEFGISYFTSPTGVKNTVGRVTTQQFPSARFADLAWSKASSSFGSEVTSAEGKLSFADFLNVFLLNQKWDLGVVIKAMQERGHLPEPGRAEPGRRERQGSQLPRRRRVPGADRARQRRQHGHLGPVQGVRHPPELHADRKRRPGPPQGEAGSQHARLRQRRDAEWLPHSRAVHSPRRDRARAAQRPDVRGRRPDEQPDGVDDAKIPGIGDIPIIGHLFRSKAAQKDQTELVVMITPEILPNDSVGVTNVLPRTPDSFLAPLPEPKTKAPLPAAFTPDRRSTVSVPVPSKASQIEQKDQREKAEAERDRLAAEARATADAERGRQEQEASASAAAARLAIDEAKKAEADEKMASKRQKEEQKRLEKEAKEREKKEREAASRAAKSGSPKAPAASLQQGDAVEQAADRAAAQQTESEEEQRARAIAEAKMRALEAASQTPAQVEK